MTDNDVRRIVCECQRYDAEGFEIPHCDYCVGRDKLVEELARRLDNPAMHSMSCDVQYDRESGDDGKVRCTCGLNALLAKARGEKGDGDGQ